jgi:SAM-dependent methyltransferase
MNRPEAATVILPVYGVGRAIQAVVRDLAIAAYGLGTRGLDLDVLLLDDGHHAAIATQVADRFGLTLTVIDGPRSGPAEAWLDGFRRVVQQARSDLVVTLDANGRHDPTQIPYLIDHLLGRRLDVVIGSRWAPGSGTPGLTLPRWILGQLANSAFRLVTGTPGVADATTSYRVARTDVLRNFDLDRVPLNSYSVHTTFVATAIARGYRVGEAPIIYRSPIGGGGGLQLRDVREFTSHLVALRRSVERIRRRRLSPGGRTFAVDYFPAEQDLECLAGSHHFFDWMLDEFAPYLHGRILEVGAGTGTITRKLAERFADASVVALEPADNMFAQLEPYAVLTPRVSAHQETLAEYGSHRQGQFDAVLYINVLEHIGDDEGEIRLAADFLGNGGALLVFGPALERLYSELDHKAGHYRRYSLDRLRKLVTSAGLRIVSLRYFDILGVLPYLLAYTWLRRTRISSSTVWSYDRLVVPLSRSIQRVLHDPPIGKNVILIAVKEPSPPVNRHETSTPGGA